MSVVTPDTGPGPGPGTAPRINFIGGIVSTVSRFCCDGSVGLEWPGDVTPLLRFEMEEVGVNTELGVM